MNKCGALEDTSRDHAWYEFHVGNRFRKKTKLSYGVDDVDRRIVSRIAQQLGLTTPELMDLVTCRMSAAEFRDRLESN